MQNIMDRVIDIVGAYVPHLVGALAILVVGWLVARIIAAGVRGALRRTNLDNRLATWLVGESVPVERTISTTVFFSLS